MQAKLVVVDDNATGRGFDLELPAVIGRSRSTDLKLGNPLVSRRHCEVFESEGLLMLRDLGSLNGTFVGGTRLADEPVAVRPGETFNVGPVTLQAEYTAAPAADEADRPGAQTLDAPLEASHETPDPSSDSRVR